MAGGLSHSHPISGKFSLDKVIGLGSGRESCIEELTLGPEEWLVLGLGAEYRVGETPQVG